MPESSLMHLKVLLPSGVFAEKANVARIVIETPEGSFGLFPQRLDCVAAIAPGILTYEITGEREVYIAVDAGVMAKTGMDVLVSVRSAIAGNDLTKLHQSVDHEFLNLSEQEKSVRLATAKMESGLFHQLAEFQHG